MAGHRGHQQPLNLGTPVVDPGPGRRTNTIGHPVEQMLNASARDILDALENGFRARADLKGKLAELFMSRHLDDLQRRGVIDGYDWRDEDATADFLVYRGDTALTLEAKNVRSGGGPLKVETQKTRATQGNPWGRRYRADAFDYIGACLYNRTGRWEYLFARAADLVRDRVDPEYVLAMQYIRNGDGIWHAELVDILP